MTGNRPGSNVCTRCDATIRWIRTRDGKPMPCNPVPDPNGNVAAMKATNGTYIDGHVVTEPDRDALRTAGYVTFRPHFADCPDGGKARTTPAPDVEPRLF